MDDICDDLFVFRYLFLFEVVYGLEWGEGVISLLLF